MAGEAAAHEPLYEETAHVTMDTDGLSPDEVPGEIIISCSRGSFYYLFCFMSSSGW